jgi:uncharacterized protein YkwD
MSYPSTSHRTSTCRLSRLCSVAIAAVLLFGMLLSEPLPSAGNPLAASTNSIPELAQSEIQMWSLINRDRLTPASAEETKGRARPLEWDDRLAGVAREHSEEMAAHEFFSHEGMDGSLPYVRVSRAGILWNAVGENIAKYPEVSQAEAAFMDEPKFQHNHRGNILNSKFTHVGVGIARGPDGILYITQEFAALR